MTLLFDNTTEMLEKLGLTTAALHLDTASQQASAQSWSYTQFLGYLLKGELDERRRKTAELNLLFAKFPAMKKLQDFDFNLNLPSIDDWWRNWPQEGIKLKAVT
jgi:DNA replication protein DnaC